MKKGLLAGVLITLLGGGLVGALVVWSGVVDVSVPGAKALPDAVLGYASTQSIRRRAPAGPNPQASNPDAIGHGLEHYRAMCVACHGGPGAEPAEFAAGLHPSPPDLASPGIQAFSDGMLYQAISGGIASTGMPAFGSTHSPDELWQIVAFLRHLPKLTDAEKKALGQVAPPEHEAPAAPTPSPGQPAAAGAKVVHINITGFKFDPPSAEVHVGDTVEWKNTDFVAHTATADDKSFDTGKIDAGESKQVVVRKAGTLGYFCRYHAAMRGSLQVH